MTGIQEMLHREHRGVQAISVAYTVVAYLFAVAIGVQVFLAGMSVFVGATWWLRHVLFGHIFGTFTVLLILLAFAARFPRRLLLLSALPLVLYMLQYGFITWAGPLGLTALSALHPVNALALFWVALSLGQQGRQTLSR